LITALLQQQKQQFTAARGALAFKQVPHLQHSPAAAAAAAAAAVNKDDGSCSALKGARPLCKVDDLLDHSPAATVSSSSSSSQG
jgi:hypothetical protein